MEILNGRQLYNLLESIERKGYKLSNVNIYIGNDEELKGIHSAFSLDIINNCDKDDKDYFVNMINDDCGNIKYNEDKINILIS